MVSFNLLLEEIHLKKYLIKRLAGTLPVLIGVTMLCFTLMTASGKDPALAVAMRSNSAGDTALIASLREEMGLDEPLPARYFLWLKGLLTGDMGKSVVTYHSITDDIKNFFPVTFRLVIMAMGWMILIVFPISMLCARFHNKMIDHIVRLLTIGGICLPVFWLGFMLLLLFAVRLQIFSVAPKAGISGYILPSFALAFPSACGAVRVMRSSLLSEIRSDYAAYARTRGLSEWQIILRHGLKNSLPPVITLFSQYLGYMLAGSAVAENVFSLKGVGTYLISCVVSGDSPAAAACIVIIATVFVTANLTADVINRLICPWMVREINDDENFFKTTGCHRTYTYYNCNYMCSICTCNSAKSTGSDRSIAQIPRGRYSVSSWNGSARKMRAFTPYLRCKIFHWNECSHDADTWSAGSYYRNLQRLCGRKG